MQVKTPATSIDDPREQEREERRERERMREIRREREKREKKAQEEKGWFTDSLTKVPDVH